jgi:nucleotidyltransferase substrate binding protein (TIGR01987 family)
MPESISTDFLEKAISQLENGLEEYNQGSQSDLLRDGVIQRFEYTYELAWKTVKRFLEVSLPSLTTIDQLSFPELIRTAWEQGLLKSSWNIWKTFRDARNQTSHAYDEKKANKVFSIVPQFLNEVKYLYQQLHQRIG